MDGGGSSRKERGGRRGGLLVMHAPKAKGRIGKDGGNKPIRNLEQAKAKGQFGFISTQSGSEGRRAAKGGKRL